MGAGAAAPTGVGSSPAPIGGSFAGGYPAVVPPASTPIATPTATPSSTPQGGKGGNPTSNELPKGKPFFGDPRGFNNGATPALNTQASSAGAAALGQPNAPTASQQPYVNPYMQTYGQNNTPQQQMFNRFPQRFQQPQPVAQPAQGPVYADQSLNAPGNQPQQYSGQPQYGRFGRGFMPQNRGGYERQMDNLRGGYNRPMPPMMPQQDGGYGGGYGQQQPGGMQQAASSAAPVDAEAAWNRTTQQAQFAPGTDMVKAKQDFMQRYNPRPQQPGGMQQAAFMNSLLNGQQMPAYNGPTQAQWGQMKNQPATGYEAAPSLGGQAPAGGKGGNPTAQLPPPPNQDGTPGSWSTYI